MGSQKGPEAETSTALRWVWDGSPKFSPVPRVRLPHPSVSVAGQASTRADGHEATWCAWAGSTGHEAPRRLKTGGLGKRSCCAETHVRVRASCARVQSCKRRRKHTHARRRKDTSKTCAQIVAMRARVCRMMVRAKYALERGIHGHRTAHRLRAHIGRAPRARDACGVGQRRHNRHRAPSGRVRVVRAGTRVSHMPTMGARWTHAPRIHKSSPVGYERETLRNARREHYPRCAHRPTSGDVHNARTHRRKRAKS